MTLPPGKNRIKEGVGDVLMAAVVSARLIAWEPGLPGIAYELADGTEGCIDGRFDHPRPDPEVEFCRSS